MKTRWALAALVLLLAGALAVRAWGSYGRWHPDEALFVTFARQAAVQGAWLLPGDLDKPPLAIYLNAAALIALGVDADAKGVLYLDVYKGEFAARCAGVLVSLLAVAVMLRLAYSLTHQRAVALLAGLLLALSPTWSAFSPTAFMDMPMLLFALAAWAAAARCRAGWSGVFGILAFAAKPQAAYWLPLILGTLLLAVPYQSWGRMLGRWLWPVALGGLILVGWDSARSTASIFALGAANNTPAGAFWAAPADWLARGQLWWDFARWLYGSAAPTLLIGVLATLSLGLRQQRALTFGLWLWIAAYSGWHLITRLNIYDRYLLLALPPLALLAAMTSARLGAWLPRRAAWSLGSMALLGLLLAALTAQTPIGSDRGANQQIDVLAEYLNAKPVATVIYDRWLGWELGYYLGVWTDKRRVYYPTPDTLAAGALALAEPGTRYFIAPDDVADAPYRAALHAAGFGMRLEVVLGRFRVYALTPPISAEYGANAESS